MASAQCHKPCEAHTSSKVQPSKSHHAAATSGHHSFTDKVKGMAESARKMFSHHEHNKPAQSCPPAGGANDGMKIKKNNNGKAEGHCMPKVHEHMKNMKKKMHRDKKHDGNNSSSSSSSSSDSENEREGKQRKKKQN